MSVLARWRSWFRPSAPRQKLPLAQRPGVEELERRDLPSTLPTVAFPADLVVDKWPGAVEIARFVPIGTGNVAGLMGAYRFGPFDAASVPLAAQQDGPGSPGGPAESSQNQVAIDANGLARNGPGPYLLNQADTTYVLQTDVRAQGTAFVVAAPNVTLDLNGHTVVYGDSPPPTVVNGGFELGHGRSVPGWNLNAASSASLVPNTSDLFGNQVLRLKSFDRTQTIVSDPIAITQVGHTYTASITPANPATGSSVVLSVVDAVTGQVLGSGASASAWRGFSAIAQFTPATADPVRLQVDVRLPSTGTRDSLDLDQATLTVSGDYGILASDAPIGDFLGLTNLTPAAQASYRNAANFTLENGSVVQGRGNGYASSPLLFRNLAGVTVQNVSTFATGMDTQTLDATYASGNVTIQNSTFRENIANVGNRMQNTATIKLNNISGPIVVSGNHLLGSPQLGIAVAQNDPHDTVQISNNEIRQNGIVSNAYGILLSAVQNFTLIGNTIAPSSGRGIDVDGYNPNALAHGEIIGNHVDVQEGFNREYPLGLPVEALRLRNNIDHMGAQRDLLIQNNTFIARTGPGQTNQADGVLISYANPDGRMSNANVVLSNNLIEAIAGTADPAYRAEALVLDRVDGGVNLGITGNVLASNDVSLAVSDTEGGIRGVALVSNTVRRSDEGAARPYTAIRVASFNNDVRGVAILDTRLDNGASPSVAEAGSGTTGVTITWHQDAVAAPAPALGTLGVSSQFV